MARGEYFDQWYTVGRAKEMAKLNAAARRAIPKSKFAVPSKAPASGSYPIPDRSHAANALARASGKPVEAQVKAKVHRLYPDMGDSHSGLSGVKHK